MSDNWQRYLDPHFANVVQALDPLLFLDKLKEIKLVASEEYTKLHNILKLESPQACARHLLQILPKKGPSSFGKFLDVLRNTPGQEHIADTVKPMDTDCTDGCVRVKDLPMADLFAVANQKASLAELRDVAKQIESVWDQVALHLDPESRIKVIRREHLHDGEFIRANAMLQQWSSKFAGQATRRQIIVAMYKAELLAEALAVFDRDYHYDGLVDYVIKSIHR